MHTSSDQCIDSVSPMFMPPQPLLDALPGLMADM
jgi:hypothetical protein